MFQAGFARVDVTPPLGNPLAGYFTARTADGILDPIELNARALRDGDNTILVISCDFIYVMESAATPIRELISEATGIPAGNILIHGLHQHTSLRIGNRSNLPMAHTVKDDAHLDVLNRKFADVARLALGDLAEGNRLVGIISHVGELKERIHRQILVTKDRSGGSRAVIRTE